MDTYLILKGVAGLGDRMKTLGGAIKLAIQTNRTLIIDWTDPTWNHSEPPKGFFAYFGLNVPPGLKILTSDAAIRSTLLTLNSCNSVCPHVWRGQMQRTDYRVDRSTSKLILDGQIILLSDEQVINCTEQIVVYGICQG
jgi:hypothetical protein